MSNGQTELALKEPGASYYAFCLAGFPHKRIPDGQQWRVQTGGRAKGGAIFTVTPGIIDELDRPAQTLGVPYGPLARRILLDLQSKATSTGRREIPFPRSLARYPTELGLDAGGKTTLLVFDQFERIAMSRINFVIGQNDRSLSRQMLIVDDYERAYKNVSGKRVRIYPQVRLSERFFDELTRDPVPVDMAVIKALGKHSMAMDIYLWCVSRLRKRTSVQMSWASTFHQFGSCFGAKSKAAGGDGLDELANFRFHFRASCDAIWGAFKKAAVDPLFSLETSRSGVILQGGSLLNLHPAKSSATVSAQLPSAAQLDLLEVSTDVVRAREWVRINERYQRDGRQNPFVPSRSDWVAGRVADEEKWRDYIRLGRDVFRDADGCYPARAALKPAFENMGTAEMPAPIKMATALGHQERSSIPLAPGLYRVHKQRTFDSQIASRTKTEKVTWRDICGDSDGRLMAVLRQELLSDRSLQEIAPDLLQAIANQFPGRPGVYAQMRT